MKTRMTTLFLCSIISIHVSFAQNTVESIRSRYKSIKDGIAVKTGDNPNDGAEWPIFYHVEVSDFLPGTGGHKEDIHLYFDEREEDKIYPSHYLTFATTRYNYSAANYYEEYLYDSDGRLAFIYAVNPNLDKGGTTPFVDCELRFYFSRGNLINAVVKERAQGESAYKQVLSGTHLDNIYQEQLGFYTDRSRKILKMFEGIDAAAYDYDE